MRGRVAGVGLALITMGAVEATGRAAPACRRVTVPGEVRSGDMWEREIGEGLRIVLQPIRSGWILRVWPVRGKVEGLDYAELATPPYNSVTPLSISTDFSFRAQDAVGWNPRTFRFAPNKEAYQQLSRAYTAMMATGANPPGAAQVELARQVAQAYGGRFRILDSRLVPGTADQWVQAGVVASHFTSTAHTLEQPADGKTTPLGRLVWLRFSVELDVPGSFVPAAGMKTAPRACDVRE